MKSTLAAETLIMKICEMVCASACSYAHVDPCCNTCCNKARSSQCLHAVKVRKHRNIVQACTNVAYIPEASGDEQCKQAAQRLSFSIVAGREGREVQLEGVK